MDEYIVRKAVRDALYETDAITMEGVKILNQFPAADVKPVVRGKWIVKYPLVTCSVCCNTFDIVGLLNFCPNCGADMREQEPKQEPAGPYDLLHEEGGWNLQ